MNGMLRAVINTAIATIITLIEMVPSKLDGVKGFPIFSIGEERKENL